MTTIPRRDVCGAIAIGATLTAAGQSLADDATAKQQEVVVRLRHRTAADVKQHGPKAAAGIEHSETWDLRRTAVIVCDMWDRHWCKSAERRVGELVGPLNAMLKTVRGRGAFVLHAPSSVTNFYEDDPRRKTAQSAPFAKTPVELSKSPRWGTAWCWTDGQREGVLPVDDTDMGCDCPEKCVIEPVPWTRQNPGIELFDGDALTDDGQETWNLLRQRNIQNVVLCGVHLNMCVLGRPFGIRQMVRLGQKVALLRDMTDTMYNPERPPGVSHFEGTRLVVEHVERFWCPSLESSDLTGEKPFRFSADTT